MGSDYFVALDIISKSVEFENLYQWIYIYSAI